MTTSEDQELSSAKYIQSGERERTFFHVFKVQTSFIYGCSCYQIVTAQSEIR